ncbi:carboxypeptidase-like protein, partial [Mucilaginibacter gracilis]
GKPRAAATKSGVRISYSEETLQKESKRITLSNASMMAGDALRKILRNTHLQYRLYGTYIIIDEKPADLKPGKVLGKVIDEKGEPLPGATIKVIQTGQAIQSATDGTYQLSLVPGTYTLEVSFVSYQTKRITELIISEGKLTQLDVALQPANNALNEVVISSSYKKASVDGLYARQKNNAGITDGTCRTDCQDAR